MNGSGSAMEVSDETPSSKKQKVANSMAADKPKGARSQNQITVDQLQADEISQLAAENWRSSSSKKFNAQV